MEKLKAGVRFSEVASQYSEDKARQGVGLLLAERCPAAVRDLQLNLAVPSCRETWAG